MGVKPKAKGHSQLKCPFCETVVQNHGNRLDCPACGSFASPEMMNHQIYKWQKGGNTLTDISRTYRLSR